MIKIIIILLTLTSTLQGKDPHTERLAVTESIMNKAKPYIEELTAHLENMSAEFDELQENASAIVSLASTNTALAQKELKKLQAKLQNAKILVFDAKKKAKAATKKIPNLSTKNELTLLTKELNSLKKQKPDSVINAQIIAKKQEIAATIAKAQHEQKIANEAQQKYVIISNSIKTRINIYAAKKNNPTNISKYPVASIPYSIKDSKIECHPDYVYTIKIKNKQSKTINSKKTYTYKTLKRNNKKHGQFDTFSDADNGHQILINNQLSFNTRMLKPTKSSFIASLPTVIIESADTTNSSSESSSKQSTRSTQTTKIQEMYEYLSTEIASIAGQINSYAQQLKNAIMETSQAESQFQTLLDLIKNKTIINKTDFEYTSLSSSLESVLENLNVIYSNIDFTMNDIDIAS